MCSWGFSLSGSLVDGKMGITAEAPYLKVLTDSCDLTLIFYNWYRKQWSGWTAVRDSGAALRPHFFYSEAKWDRFRRWKGNLSINVVLLQNARIYFSPLYYSIFKRKIMTSTFQIEIENLSHLSHYLNHSILYRTIRLFTERCALDGFSRNNGAFSSGSSFWQPLFFLLMLADAFLLFFQFPVFFTFSALKHLFSSHRKKK